MADPQPPHEVSADAAKTTTGLGQLPPLAEDLKKTLQGGVHVTTPSYSNTVFITVNKLNPSAANFVPKPTDSSAFTTTTTLPTSAPTHPIYSKFPTPTTSTSSRLDPSSKEFVPSTMPAPPMANGGPNMLENGDDYFEEDLNGYLDVKDIMGQYEKASPTAEGDTSSKPVLKEAAEMLLRTYNYPGSFDEIKKNFQMTLSTCIPSDSTLTNLAEMLVYWVRPLLRQLLHAEV